MTWLKGFLNQKFKMLIKKDSRLISSYWNMSRPIFIFSLKKIRKPTGVIHIKKKKKKKTKNNLEGNLFSKKSHSG